MMIPARHQRIVAQKPAKTNQLMFRRTRMAQPLSAQSRFASSSIRSRRS